MFCTFWLGNVLRATTPCTFLTSLLPKALREVNGALLPFWLRTVLRATTPCTFRTSQLPKCSENWMARFYHFDFERCFGPQPHALFEHRNFQKWSDTEVLLAFWLRNLLRAKMACIFSSLISPDGSTPAALASLLFDPPAPKHWKNTMFRDFSTFSRTCIFLLLTLSFLWSSFFFSSLILSSLLWLFPPLLFHLSILSKVWPLNLLRQRQKHLNKVFTRFKPTYRGSHKISKILKEI